MDIDEHFELWRKREPWFYSKSVFNETTYALIMGAIFSLTFYCLVAYPIIVNLSAVFFGYFLAQFIFGWGHMTTHALYMESPPEEWEPGVLVAYMHHYEHPRAIYIHWLNHRLNFLMQTKGCLVAYVGAWVLPFVLFGGAILPLFFWFLFWFSMVEPVHEYYHVPRESKKKHFSFLMYHWLRLLEVSGIISAKKHRDHHLHSAANFADVHNFTDLRFPCLDAFFDGLWRAALSIRNNRVFKGRPIRKAIYAMGSILIPLTFVLCSYLFCWGGML